MTSVPSMSFQAFFLAGADKLPPQDEQKECAARFWRPQRGHGRVGFMRGGSGVVM